jgi:hypothetical protein
LPAGGLAADPGQMQAQVIGALAISGWVLVSSSLLLKLMWRPDPALPGEESDPPAAQKAEA